MREDLEYDDDFPIIFCPVCGSHHTTGCGKRNPLLNDKESWQDHCNTCQWDFEIFIIKRGKKKFKFRFDDMNCLKCAKENPYLYGDKKDK